MACSPSTYSDSNHPGGHGFNLSDVPAWNSNYNSPQQEVTAYMPYIDGGNATGGEKVLVSIAYKNGNDAFFQSLFTTSYTRGGQTYYLYNDPQVWGYFMDDEPSAANPVKGTSPSDMQAQINYIKGIPGWNSSQKFFMSLYNYGTALSPDYDNSYNGIGVDYFGITAYPIHTTGTPPNTVLHENYPGGSNRELLPNGNPADPIHDAIAHATGGATWIDGGGHTHTEPNLSASVLIPIYQAFGNYAGSDWYETPMPTVTEELNILQEWGTEFINHSVTSVPFTWTYVWGITQPDGSTYDYALEPVSWYNQANGKSDPNTDSGTGSDVLRALFSKENGAA